METAGPRPADVVVHVIGERPGGDARASRSLSAYRVPQDVRPAAAAASGSPGIRHDYSVFLNIYAGGLAPVEAAGFVPLQPFVPFAERPA